MRDMVDPNRSQREGEGVANTPDALQPKEADTVMSNTNSVDSQHEANPSSTGRCPYHAMLEALGL